VKAALSINKEGIMNRYYEVIEGYQNGTHRVVAGFEGLEQAEADAETRRQENPQRTYRLHSVEVVAPH